MSDTTSELRQQLEEIDYSDAARQADVVNMPNFYIIPKRQLVDFIIARDRRLLERLKAKIDNDFDAELAALGSTERQEADNG